MTFILQDEKALYRLCAVVTCMLLKRTFLCMEVWKCIRRAELAPRVVFKEGNTVNSHFFAERLKEKSWTVRNVITESGYLGDYFHTYFVYVNVSKFCRDAWESAWESPWIREDCNLKMETLQAVPCCSLFLPPSIHRMEELWRGATSDQL